MHSRYLEFSSDCRTTADALEDTGDLQSVGCSFSAIEDSSTSHSPDETAQTPYRVLLAEDNPGDVFLVDEALQCAGFHFDLIAHRDGEEIINSIEQVEAGTQPLPHIVLLDLNLPKRDGKAVLSRMRKNSLWKQIPVVVITSSDSLVDRESVRRLGVNNYFRKPLDIDEYMKLGGLVRNILR